MHKVNDSRYVFRIAVGITILGLFLTGSACAAEQVSKLDIRGTAVTGTGAQLWNAQTFAAFFYDLKYDVSTETLDLIGVTDRTIAKDNLWYNTTTARIDFKVYEKESVNVSGRNNYSLVGWQAEKWVGVKDIANKIAKLAFEMGKEDKKTLTTGETWSLGAGYELTVDAINARTTPRQVWFTLKKDGAIVDEGIGQAPVDTSTSEKTKAVYYKTKTILGESDALLFTFYVDTIFSGATSDMVQFKYAWLIDESSAKEIKAADKFGVFEVRTATSASINLSNENTVSLSRNTESTLMGNLKFKTADNDTLRFYPYVEYTTPGYYELRGSVVDQGTMGNKEISWDAQSFAAFYYDLKYDRSTETLKFVPNLADLTRTIARENLWYNTTIARADFKVYEKELVNVNGDTNYSVVGWQAQKWIGINDKANKIAKLAFEMGKEDKRTLTTGETWSLGTGYELTINAIDARTNPRQVWFTLKKDNVIVDEGIGQAPAGTNSSEKQKAVYYKTRTILGESDSLLFTAYVDTIFSGATSDMVQFKYAWLIDESTAKEIKAADKFGVFEVRSANTNYINLSNENTVSLSSNTETTLMGDIKFKVADNASVMRFYPKIDYVIPEIGTTPDYPISTVSFETPGVIMSVNSSRILNLTLNIAPTGLSGYNITISSINGSVAQIVDVGFPQWATLHNNSSLPSNTIWIKAADIDRKIEPGASNTILARVELRGEAPGITHLMINIRRMDDENGAMINPNTIKTYIDVISIPAFPGFPNSPTDPDSDGLYEDINGNGRKDYNDVVELFNYLEWVEMNEPVSIFDFNKNGRMDFNDIIRLFGEL